MGVMENGEETLQGGGNEEKIYVSVRVRPLNAKEISRNDVSDWECINANTIIYKNANFSAAERSMYPTAYTFDRVFRTDCSTRQVYEQAAKDVALSVVSGMNSSVFAYGQTSSGKTYTMTGVTEYAIADIFEYLEKHTEREFVLKFSAMEIYNESVRDLLGTDSTPLRLLDDPERGTIVEKLTEEVITDWNHILELLSICEAQRQIGETSLNETSSRSHQIIRLTVESTSREFLGKDSFSALSATVNFVDLAGSERASLALSAGTRLKEGGHINRSLLTLGTVIRKLSKGRNGHIPYRDSKLTRILQTSLGGNARTAIICTMSPARIHVEQSRNTLLFASCAKEVNTTAQVNVVMSDKALVKHLQRELERLENQLRSPQSHFSTTDHDTLLREKDLQIERLENEVKELMLQRDIAQIQVKELLRKVGDDGDSTIQVDSENYPHIRVQKSPETLSWKSSVMPNSRSLEVDIRTLSDEQSRASFDDHLARVPYFEENITHGVASPRPSTSSDTNSYQVWEQYDRQSNGLSEDLCKEVRCIEIEETSQRDPASSNHLTSEENNGIPALGISESGDGPEQRPVLLRLSNDQESVLSQSKDNEDGEPITMPSKKERGLALTSLMNKDLALPSLKEKRESNDTNILETPSPEASILENHLAAFSSDGSGSLRLRKSRSCKASIFTDLAFPFFKMDDYTENTPSDVSERDLVSRIDRFERKISHLDFGSKFQQSSNKGSYSPAENAFDIEIDALNDKILNAENLSSEKDVFPTEKNVAESPVKEKRSVAKQTSKSVKDIGLDPIEDETRSPLSWPLQFKKLQREIIELWDACNVSLIHRTYFYLLFQGDPSDSVYMEVEMRRMNFLKDKFSRGESTVVNGRSLTLASSLKGLRQERRMLSKQMVKKLTEQERESVFLKWGVGITTKLRRLQLAHLVWTKTDDMNHIADSAYLVAKLVGFMEPEQAPKEMFGLNFTPRSVKRSFSLTRSLTSLL